MSNPKIIYDVEFRIDSSKVDTIANSLSKSDKATKSVTKSTSRYSEEIKKVIDQNQVHIQEINKTQTAINAKIKAERNDIATQKEQVKIARKKREQLVKVRGALNDQLKSTKLNNAERARLSGQVARLNNQEKGLIQTEHNYVRALNETVFGLEKAENATESYNQSSRALQGQQKSTNRVIASSNQVFFSASDFINDSAQFSYGWASGMRAVGNNIGYTAELLASLKIRAEQANRSLGSVLKQSIKGVGGAMLALNVAITAGTMLLTKFGKESKEVSGDLEELFSAMANIRDFGTFDFMGRGGLQRQIEEIESVKDVLEDIISAQTDLNDIAVSFKDNIGIIEYNKAKDALKSLEKQFGYTADEAQELIDKQEILQKKLDLLNTRSASAQLALYIEALEDSTDKAKLYQLTGVQDSEVLKARIDDHYKLASSLKFQAIKSEEARVKMEGHLKAAKDLENLAKTFEAPDINFGLRDDNESMQSLIKAFRELHEVNRLGIDVPKLPPAVSVQGLDEDINLERFSFLQGLIRSAELSSLEGLAKEKLAIEQKYEDIRTNLRLSGIEVDGEIQNQLEINKKIEVEQAKTRIQEQENKKRLENEQKQERVRSGILQGLRRSAELSSLEGLDKEKLIIEQKYEDIRAKLRSNDIKIDGEIQNQLEINKKIEVEQAKTRTEEEEGKKRQKLRDTLQKTSFSLASQYIGALSQLNQAQSDDTEKQARKKFETQKKLQKSSALVNAGQAVIRQFTDLPFPAALASSLAVGLITKKQIDAINAVDFEGGGTSSVSGASTGSSSSQGFSEASFSNPVAIKAPTYTPQNAQQTDSVINITLQTEADDTVIAMKAENGRKQMITNSVTVTNG